jgi:hypothetical protein
MTKFSLLTIAFDKTFSHDKIPLLTFLSGHFFLHHENGHVWKMFVQEGLRSEI